jgi:hypothetical protein
VRNQRDVRDATIPISNGSSTIAYLVSVSEKPDQEPNNGNGHIHTLKQREDSYQSAYEAGLASGKEAAYRQVTGKASPTAANWATPHARRTQRHILQQARLKKQRTIVRADLGVCHTRIADAPPTAARCNVRAAGPHPLGLVESIGYAPNATPESKSVLVPRNRLSIWTYLVG